MVRAERVVEDRHVEPARARAAQEVPVPKRTERTLPMGLHKVLLLVVVLAPVHRLGAVMVGQDGVPRGGGVRSPKPGAAGASTDVLRGHRVRRDPRGHR